MGLTRATCNVLAHGAKVQGEGTLCKGCRTGKGCTERYVYSKGGVALMQGHVGACETQVLAQLTRLRFQAVPSIPRAARGC